MGIPSFLTFLEDGFQGNLSLGLLITLAVAPAGSLRMLALQGCMPGSEAVFGGGGMAAGILSCLAVILVVFGSGGDTVPGDGGVAAGLADVVAG